MSCSVHGLNLTHWLICIAVGSLGLILALLTKLFTPKSTEVHPV